MKKENLIKNYVILFLISFLTIFLTFKILNYYKRTVDYYESFSPLYNVLSEIKIGELDNYLLENPNVVIYIVDGNFKNAKEMDEIIKEIVITRDLNDQFVVLDITNNEEKDKLITLLDAKLKKYKTNLFVKTNILVLKDGKIVDILSPKTTNAQSIIIFLEKNGIN